MRNQDLKDGFYWVREKTDPCPNWSPAKLYSYGNGTRKLLAFVGTDDDACGEEIEEMEFGPPIDPPLFVPPHTALQNGGQA